MAVLDIGSCVGGNYGVNEMIAMLVAVKGWLIYGLVNHVGNLGRKINRQLNVNVGAEEMN